jgi:hypothetical protein
MSLNPGITDAAAQSIGRNLESWKQKAETKPESSYAISLGKTTYARADLQKLQPDIDEFEMAVRPGLLSSYSEIVKIPRYASFGDKTSTSLSAQPSMNLARAPPPSNPNSSVSWPNGKKQTLKSYSDGELYNLESQYFLWNKRNLLADLYIY